MAAIDHVVLWVDDPLAAAEFYETVVGFAPVRLEEFRAGQCPFPSVRVSDTALLDLMARVAAPIVEMMSGATGSAGHPVNHVCFSLSAGEYKALGERLAARGIALSATLQGSFGARGLAPEAFYFRDPDGNVLEARYYAE